MKEFKIIKSMTEFFISKLFKSERWYYKSLDSYRKNYFSIIHSGKYNLENYTDVIQYMMSNTLQKNIDIGTLILSADFFSFCAKNKVKSNSQFLQDLFVLYFLDNKEKGFFVEFGACDGIDLSNTFILEKDMGWGGILAEPDKYYFQTLLNNRNCNCCQFAVYKESGQLLQFSHVIGDAKLSTISQYQEFDAHTERREKFETLEISTITLDELLDTYNAPEIVDYISIDTEGSELDILRGYSFKKRRMLCWTIEHNHNEVIRKEVLTIMSGHGYCRVLEGFSECDDWYVDIDVFRIKANGLLSQKK